MATDDTPVDRDESPTETDDSPTEAEHEAIHEIELGLEWLQRAQGSLLEFHHATGHGMDHLALAERRLRESDHDALADEIRDELLPHGVVDGDRWSYDVVESFQTTILAEADGFETRARQEIADGRRHLVERRQERAWKGRSRR